MGRYVYHAPVEPEPRATASGGQNVVETGILHAQYIPRDVHAAAIERPSYVPLGYITDNPIVRGLLPGRLPAPPVRATPLRPVCPSEGCTPPRSGVSPTYVLRDPVVILPPVRLPYLTPTPGATNTVPQPPPSAGGSQVVPVGTVQPMSPAPSPTVAVSPTQTAPQLTQPGTPLDSKGATISVEGGVGGWLAQSSLINGIPNWGIAAAGVFLAMTMFGGKAGRR